MRILRVAQKIYPEAKGGGAYHVHAMSRDQVERGHDVTVLTIGDGPSKETRNGYTVVRRSALLEPLGNAIAPGIAKFLRQTGSYDVVHAHSHLYSSTNLAAFARRFSKTPLAITNHGLYSQTVSERIFDVYLRTLGKWTFNQADVVFTYSDAEREDLRGLGVQSDIEVVSNGIDSARFSPDGPGDERIESPAILFVGRLVEGKRPIDVVHTLAEVYEKGIDAKLYVAGEGPLEPDMRQAAAENGVEESIVFLGYVSYDEMPNIYRSSDVLVLPSRDEGMPRTVLEAMASGTPVVASDLPQIESILAGSGQTVPIGDISALASALVDELESSATGSEERELLPHEFEWERTVDETTRTLESLANLDSREL